MEAAKIVARYADGKIIKGYTFDFSPDGSRFHLLPARADPSRRTVEVLLKDLKALFFVRHFAGNPGYAERRRGVEGGRRPGRQVEVVFGDGEVLVGYTMGYDPQRPGFFLFPADPQSNNLRVYVVLSAVKKVAASMDHRNARTLTPTAGGVASAASKLIGDIEAVGNVLRQTVSEWEPLARGVEGLSQDYAQLQARCERVERVERERQELRDTLDRLRPVHDEAVRALTEFRSAHAALVLEHQANARALRELREQHEAALRERQSAATRLDLVLHRLQA